MRKDIQIILKTYKKEVHRLDSEGSSCETTLVELQCHMEETVNTSNEVHTLSSTPVIKKQHSGWGEQFDGYFTSGTILELLVNGTSQHLST